MADRHTTQARQAGLERSPKAFLRSTIRGAVVPLLASGIVASSLLPAAGVPVSREGDLVLQSAPSYQVLHGETLRPRVSYMLPVKGYHLTARFGDSSGLWAHRHTGLDFAAPTGTSVHAIARGTVVSAGYDGSYGNKVVVRLADGTELWFCHLTSMYVAAGDVLGLGQVLGAVGSTGNTTGPHLHLEVRPHPETPIDPEPWLRAHGLHP